MTSHRRKTDALPTCMNCTAVLYGAYCSQCGQRAVEPITWKRGFARTWSKVRAFDFRWLRTAAALTIDPGRMIRRYVRGRRLPYVSPPVYAVVAVALCIGVVIWMGADLQAPGTPWSVGETQVPPAGAVAGLTSEPPAHRPMSGSDAGSDAGPDTQLAQTVFALCVASSLLVAAPTSFVQHRLFRRQPFTPAETYVFQLYVFGHLAIHQALFAVLGAFASTVGLVALAIVIALQLAFALSGFYRRGLFASLPAALLLATMEVAGVFVLGSLARMALET